ncbi:MAG: dihydroorotate dehydrogenase [Chloroflexi bacterium]|nr:dihydroorotate dehydrogenase [Chloroflexota bacterium]
MTACCASNRKRFRDVLAIRNPVILGSGPPGHSAKGLVRYGQYAGAVVSKSITFLPRKGNPHPRVVSLGNFGLINWENLPNPGYKRFADELRAAKAQCKCPVIASLGPSHNIDELRTMALSFEEAGADALELNFKWGFDPNTGQTRYNMQAGKEGFESTSIFEIIVTLKKAVSIPIIAKLAALAGDLVNNAKAAESAGADAITAINTIFPAMKIDITRQKPALSTCFGGLSGKSILPLSVATVYRIYEAVNIPIIGCGGVTSGEDALEMIMAGADAVQICTAAMVEGPSVFRRINDEINTLVKGIGFGSVNECRGVAHL